MTVDELSTAIEDLAALAVEIAPERPEAAKLLLDASGLACEELLARAFGGGAEAHEYAAKVRRERSGQH